MKITDFVNKYISECLTRNIDPADSNYGLAFVIDKSIRMKMIEKAGTIDSDEYINLKAISEKYKTQFNIINNSVILNWLLLQKETNKESNENNNVIIKTLLNSAKTNTNKIDSDHKTLTESAILSLFEINKDLELRNKLIEILSYNQYIQDTINYLTQTYSFYYNNDKPYGVITNDGIYRIEKIGTDNNINEFKYKLINDKNNLFSNFVPYIKNDKDLKAQYSYTYINDFSNFNPNENDKYCYAKFIMTIISGVLGIYEPLSSYLVKKNINNISSDSQLNEFLSLEIPKILAQIILNNNWIKNNNIEDVKKIVTENQIFKNVIDGFRNAFIIEEYEKKVNTKIRICNINVLRNDKELSNKNSNTWRLFSKYCAGTAQPAMLVTNHEDTFSGQCAPNSGQKILIGIPSWAYKNIDNIIKGGGLKWNAIPIGKNMKTETAVKLNFGDNFGWMVNLIAGSGSGKGVTTMAIVGAAIAMKYPIIYLDCKPDMANTIHEYGGLSIDGNVSNHYISQADLENMANRFMTEFDVTLSNGVTIEDIYTLCRTIVWCRAVEIFMHLVHIRAQYKGKNTELIKFKSDESLNLHPILVMDEFEAESQIIQSILTVTNFETIERSDKGEMKKVNSVGGTLLQILKNNTSSLNQIVQWVKGIWGTGSEGMRGQIKTAFGRQAGCLFFTISQDIPSGYSSDKKYGALLADMLKDYMNTGFITIYGKGTDNETTKYSLSRLMPAISNQEKLEQGQFGIRHPGGVEKTKTFLTIDNAIDNGNLSNNAKKAYNKITDSNILRQALEQIATDVEIEEKDNKLKIKNTNIFERRIDTLEYIYSLANGGISPTGKENIKSALKENFKYSIEFFDSFCKALYNQTLKERLTTVRSEDFYNYLGCSIANEGDRNLLLKKKQLEDYAKALYSYRHQDEINAFFDSQDEENKKIEDEAKVNDKKEKVVEEI